MNWKDIDDIAFELFESHPGVDPLSLRFTTLRDMILELPTFQGDRSECNEAKLEAIQMAWLKEREDD